MGTEIYLEVIKYVGGVPEISTTYKVDPSEGTYYTIETAEIISTPSVSSNERVWFVVSNSNNKDLVGKRFDSSQKFHDFLATLAGMQNTTKRPSWDDYFMLLAKTVASRSTCLRRQIGAVVIDPKHKRVLATGYNGAPKGTRHCLESGCLRQKLGIKSGEREELCKAVHAEANLITQAALTGTSLEGGHVYCTTKPCLSCLKLLINAGIAKVFYTNDYPVKEDLYWDLVKTSGIELTCLDSSKESQG